MGGIPYPSQGESAEWEHAIVAVGYYDNKKIKNLRNNKTTTGALLIRNSWGKDWGDKGYGWRSILRNLFSIRYTENPDRLSVRPTSKHRMAFILLFLFFLLADINFSKIRNTAKR